MRQTSLPNDYDAISSIPSTGKNNARTSLPITQARKNIPSPTLHNFASKTIFADTFVKTLIGANKNRRYLSIQNLGAVDIFVSYGGVASTTGDDSERLPPNSGKTFENGIVPNNEVTIIASASCRVTVTEGVRAA